MTSAPPATERELHAGGRMSDLEALMWSAERDPMLSSAIGSVSVLDSKPDFARFIESMERASRQLLRLRERVEEGVGIAPPRWVIDRRFDIANHVHLKMLPAGAGDQDLFDLAAQIFAEPFAVGRPLWRFVIVQVEASPGKGAGPNSGLQGAAIMKLHHSVSDGIGALRLAEMYLDLERNPAAIVDDAVEPVAPRRRNPLRRALGDVTHVVRSRADLARRGAAEVSLWGADPERARSKLRSAADLSGSLLNQMVGSDLGSAGSELWSNRSTGRHLAGFEIPLETMRQAATVCGGTINDVFVAGSVSAATRFHLERDLDVPRFNVSFVMSTRSDAKAGGNAFAPVAFTVPTTAAGDHEQFKLVKHAMSTKRGDAGQMSASLNFSAAIAQGLPSSLLTRSGRARAARLDWATSNLRGAPFAMFTAGAKIERMYPIGPTAGTAFNLTAISYDGTMHFGLFSDTASVDAPDELRDHLKQIYESMAAGNPR